ncbi:MAG: hypothetical protein M0Z94_02080 [Dehalococcoidales bacterium]|nr:hypothetical protein [Dehalococcoidales bacterium]
MRRVVVLLALAVACVGLLGQPDAFSASPSRVYLPLVSNQEAQGSSAHQVNISRLSDETSWKQLAIFWLGKVGTSSNYADVRIGY